MEIGAQELKSNYIALHRLLFEEDTETLAKITELEALLSKKLGKDVVLVAFSI